MIVPSILLSFYADLQPVLDHVYQTVNATLSGFAGPRNFPISGRIKSVESLAEKIETGRYARIVDIDDLIAFTVIIPDRIEEMSVKHFLSSQFEVIRERGRASVQTAPETFRFDFTRLFFKLSEHSVTTHVDPRIATLIVEVQVRTAFEHAWAVATHDGAYKTDAVDWRRKRLAAQLKAIVENLDAVVAVFNPVADATISSSWPQLDDLLAVQHHFNSLFSSNQLPSILKPRNMSRFCENVVEFVRDVRPPVNLTNCLEYFVAEVTKGTFAPLPTSLSLYQLFVGALYEAELFTSRMKRPCHITEELLTLFPKTRKIAAVFEYSWKPQA